MRLLIIDDQKNITLSLKEAIEPAGHECIISQYPKKAIDLFKKEHFDAVVTDYKMPQMTGIGVLKTVRSLKPDTPVILLTGYADVHNAVQALNNGAYAFFQKPINLKEFFNTLKKIEKTVTKNTEKEKEFDQLMVEKDVLIREIHHRVKNNLQVIQSLLKLQSLKIQNEEAIDILQDTYNRIFSMSLVQNRIYRQKQLNQIDFYQIIKQLTSSLQLNELLKNKNISFHLNINKIYLGIDTAIPCALIINELVTNALHHAFPEKNDGEINIECHFINNKKFNMDVSDNGIGFPQAEIQNHKNSAFGLHLVSMLVEDQLNGKLKMSNKNGAHFKIQFPYIENSRSYLNKTGKK